LQPELSDLGIAVAAVGSGTSLMAKAFQEEYKFGGKLFVDQKRSVYSALECNRGVTYILKPKALLSYKKALEEGFANGSVQGDGLQLGGIFLISKSQGILWQHLEKFAGDHASSQEIMEAAQEATK